MSKPRKAQTARVSIGPDVATPQALIDRGGKAGTMAPSTATYQSNPAFKGTMDDFVTSTQKLDASQTKVNNLEAQLAQARADRDQAYLAAEDAHGAAAKAIEKVSVTPADVQSYGFASLDVVKTGLVLPVGILASYNHTTKTIHVHVKYPAGIHGKRCILEISPDPAGTTTYHRVDGDGIRRALTGFTPGTYWLHAATSAAGGRSDWFGPVSVIVT